MGGQVLKELVGHPKALAFTRKPLESFEQRSHMIGLIFLKHHSDVLRINFKETNRKQEALVIVRPEMAVAGTAMF